ncbi:MAG: ClpXP protease specificity-enhancing factor SspB [Neomegalonema sp.]|nr:ClpXP protease specificity-enhancing factor SspB [Neomegalonema sp.]
MTELNYGQMMQRAMQGLVAEALSLVAENGLPGDHHFYITFRTNSRDVEMPEWLREAHPRDITIVLQHEFSGLTVSEDGFSVTLSFSDQPATLVVPFDAIEQFADPKAEFGLRFDTTDFDDDADLEDAEIDATDSDAESELEAELSADVLPAPDQDARDKKRRAESPEDGDADKPAGEVVSLDAFRNR